jgi:hypothetical protein
MILQRVPHACLAAVEERLDRLTGGRRRAA